MIKLAAKTLRASSPLIVAKTGRWRTVIVGCLLPLHTGILWASPAFSKDQHQHQYIPSGLPGAMLRYYEPHHWAVESSSAYYVRCLYLGRSGQ